MKFVIRPATPNDTYKGKQIEASVSLDIGKFVIDGIERTICQIGGKWWIIPQHSEDDELCSKIGPFKSVELAYTTLKMLA